MMIPTVIESDKYGSRAFDLYSRMLEDRVVFVNGEINEIMANLVCAQLLFLDFKSPGSPIQMFINSPGGSVDAGYAIYDTMCYISSPIVTIGMGICASMAMFLLSAKTGREGSMRTSLPNTRIMMHQNSGGAGNQCSDILVSAKEMVKMKQKFINTFSEWSGQSVERVQKDIERDYWMNAAEALEYGFIDKIISRKDDYTKDKSMNLEGVRNWN